MTGWQIGLLILVLVVGVGLGCWFLSADRQHKKDLNEWQLSPKDTVYYAVLDTVWREVIRVKTLSQTLHDTIWAPLPSKPTSDTLLYVVSADTANERFRAHLEYAQPEPLSPEGFFQNFRVDIRDSIRTVEVTITKIETVTEYPIPWFIACGAVFGGLGYYLGTR